MKPVLVDYYNLIWEANNKPYIESLGNCSQEYLQERLKERSGFINNNGDYIKTTDVKIQKIKQPILDDHFFIKEFDNIDHENCMYIPIDRHIDILKTEKEIVFYFELYIAQFEKENFQINIYKLQYICDKDLLKIYKINKNNNYSSEIKTTLITYPKSKQLIDDINKNDDKIILYNELINFLMPIIKAYFL